MMYKFTPVALPPILDVVVKVSFWKNDEGRIYYVGKKVPKEKIQSIVDICEGKGGEVEKQIQAKEKEIKSLKSKIKKLEQKLEQS